MRLLGELMRQVNCKSIITIEEDNESNVSMAKINTYGVEIYPACCKTINLSLPELKALIAEIEEFKKGV